MTNHHRVVYYITNIDYPQAVKIGTTVNLPKRLGKYRTQKQYANWQILAVERGNIEGERHTQFHKSNIVGEWFWLTPDLESHIATIGTEDIEVFLP